MGFSPVQKFTLKCATSNWFSSPGLLSRRVTFEKVDDSRTCHLARSRNPSHPLQEIITTNDRQFISITEVKLLLFALFQVDSEIESAILAQANG